MLKLRKVTILGFKSFCDRTEVPLAGHGIAAVVGPNGCGKSNISDAITWVLGEQSAKSLRGIKMEDVIFAGTRTRKATGMAEVSLTLVDPEVYDNSDHEAGQHLGPELVRNGQVVPDLAAQQDWDESEARRKAAEETEEATAEAQPGTTYEARIPKKRRAPLPENASELEILSAQEAAEEDERERESEDPEHALIEHVEMEADTEAEPEAEASLAPASGVTLKIRRRKFGRAPIRAGEITITRRLFRTGDSEYLLNGKICRLRDIQDIFMGTGLGGETYAIIGQERIGQLLSSKPLDRRGIIEEAAGITRFKTKKRLAELRLEAAKLNLARVNDIFEEVTKQMTTLKRQAAKAERYQAVHAELRDKLRVVLASRLAQMDAEQTSIAAEIARLTADIDTQAAALETMDADHTAGTARGYELDTHIRDANTRANHAAVELERITARTTANADRIADLTERLATGEAELADARAQHATLAGELEQHRSFLETATAEATTARDDANAQQAQAFEATRNVLAAEATTENDRRAAVAAMQRANQANNEIAQAEAALANLVQEGERLEAESAAAREELAQLGQQRGQARLSFEDVTERLKRLEADLAQLRDALTAKRNDEQTSRRRGDELRAELASLTGRRTSLEALIAEHSYSTDTVRDILAASKKQASLQQSHLGEVGTLADFLEVEGKYESVVDEFLRDELNYLVVKNWDAAEQGVHLLQKDVTGRATFLIHSGESSTQATVPAADQPHGEGVVPLRDCIRVLNGFGRSLEDVLPKLRNGYIVPDVDTARALAAEHAQSFFLAPSGETFHNITVTGGRPRSQGPLALKRELADVQARHEATQNDLAQNETATTALLHEIADITATRDARDAERRDAERDTAQSGAALRQMESEASRIESRLQQWQVSASRNKDARQHREELISSKRDEAQRFTAEQTQLEQHATQLTERIAALRASREELQAAAAAAAAALAGLEERRRNATANFDQTNRLYEGQAQRLAQLEAQLSAATGERQRREEENHALATEHTTLTELRAVAVAEADTLSAQATELRAQVAELDAKLRTLRHETEALRETRATHTTRAAKLTSDVEHLEDTTRNELSIEPADLRADASIARIEAELLATEEEAARALKQRLEAMGPVNMMALEEYTETATRHNFLEGQRTDLIDAIENTQASIKEIDEVSREKFDAAFTAINENFAQTFTKLFGGGQAHMRLTDPEGATESGIDIVASPPGKKLQNVLLLSGGEKALTALSLLVGIFQFQPAPFCILDEVDAPLDDTNVGRFARLIADMAETTQFVVITHSKRTMEQADVMYGVTMQEPGVSKIVSVTLGGKAIERAKVA